VARISPVQSFVRGLPSSVAKVYNSSVSARNKLKFFDMDEINLSYPAFVAVICGFVELPRLWMARDKDERRDILIRDVTTIATILLAKDALKAFCAKIFSKKNGLALVQESKENRSVFKKVIDYLNPRGGTMAYSTDFLRLKYANIHNYKNGIVDFAEFVNENGGDFKKLISMDENIRETVKKIIEGSGNHNFDKMDSKKLAETIKELNKKGVSFEPFYEIMRNPNNAISRKATLVNSSFDFASLFAVCAFLGFGLPFLNDKITSARYKNKKSGVDFNSPGFFSAKNAVQLRQKIMQMTFLGKTHLLAEQAPLKDRLKSLTPYRENDFRA